MIFGDPDRFAMQMDIVDIWNRSTDGMEGIVNVFMGGSIIGRQDIITSSLYQNYVGLSGGALAHPVQVTQDEFELDAVSVVRILTKARFPYYSFYSKEEYLESPDSWDDALIDADLTKDGTFELLSQYRRQLFVMGFGREIRLLCFEFSLDDVEFFNLSDLKTSDILDVIVSVDYLHEFLAQMKAWCQKIGMNI
jgi:hypothetical protein